MLVCLPISMIACGRKILFFPDCTKEFVNGEFVIYYS